MKVGSLEIDLLANIARLQQDMAKAQAVVGKSLGAMEQNAQRVMGTMSKLGGVFSLVLGGSAIGALGGMADEWGQINSKLKLATASANEFNVVQKRLFDLTSGTHGSFEQISGLYVRTAESLRQLGYSTNETVGQVEALTYALNINATDTQQSNSVINAWSKAMLTGKMSAQEYNTIVAYSPRLQQALADSLGVSNQALNEMAKEGKITSDVMVGVTGQIQKLAEEADEMPVTIGESFGRLRTHLMEYVGRANETYGVTEKITDAIDALASNIDIVMVGVTALGATAVPALVFSLKALTVAVATNPIGLLAVGIAATVAYFISIRDEIDKFNSELDALGAAWDVYSGMFMDFWDGVLDFLRPIFGGVFDWLQGLWDKAVDATEGTEMSFDATFMAIAGGIDTVRSYTYGALAAMSAAYEATASNIKNYFLSAYDAVIGGTVAMINGIIDGLNAINPFEQIGHIKGYEKTAGEIVNVLDAMSGAFNDVKTATDGHVKSLFENAKATRKLEREVEALEGWYEELNEAADSNTRSIISNTSVTDTNTKSIKANAAAITEAEKAIEELEKQRQEALKTQRDTISNIKDEIARRRDEIATFGKGKYAIDELAIARLKEQEAALIMMGAQGDVIELLQQEIEEREKLLGLDRDLDQLEEEARVRQEMADEAIRMNEQIGSTLTDALMRAFEGGKGFAKSMRDTVVNMFKTMVLRPILQPVMMGLAGGITGALGFSGAANAAQSGANALGLGDAVGMSSLFTNFGSSMSGMVQNIGGNLASMNGMLGDFGANLVMNADTIGSALDIAGGVLSYGMGAYNIAKGNYGAGIGAIGGQFLGGPIGGFIGGTLGGMLDGAFKGETRSGGRWTYDKSSSQARWYEGPSGGHGGQATTDAMTQVMSSAVSMIDSVFEGVGVQAEVAAYKAMFESSGKGRGGTFSGGTLLIDGQEASFGTNVKGAGYGSRSASAEQSFEDMTKDMAYSTLEAWQLVADQMPTMLSDMLRDVDVRSLGVEQAGALASEISATVFAVNEVSAALEALPFATLKGLTFDLTASLMEAAGGLQNLTAGIGNYYQGFYSEQERFELAAKQLSDGVAELGFELPDARDGFRGLVDSLDAMDDVNHDAIAGLLNLSGAAAEYYDFLEGQGEQRLESIGRFNELFQTEERQFELLAKDLRRSVSGLGLEMPGTRDEFRELTESLIDADGRFTDASISLMGLADDASRYYTELERQADNAIKRAQEASQITMSAAQDIANTFIRASESVRSQLTGLSERIQLDIMGSDEERYGFHKSQFDAYAKQLSEADDMQRIQDLVSKMTGSASSAYNLLAEDVRRGGKGQEYIATLNQIQAQADERLEIAKEKAAKEKAEELKIVGEAIAKELVKILDGSGAKLEKSAEQIGSWAADVSSGLSAVSGAIESLRGSEVTL